MLLYQFPSAAAPHYLISVFSRICQCHVLLSLYVFFSPCKCGMGPGGVHTDISTRPTHKQVYVLFLTSFFLIIKKNKKTDKPFSKVLLASKIVFIYWMCTGKFTEASRYTICKGQRHLHKLAHISEYQWRHVTTLVQSKM